MGQATKALLGGADNIVTTLKVISGGTWSNGEHDISGQYADNVDRNRRMSRLSRGGSEAHPATNAPYPDCLMWIHHNGMRIGRPNWPPEGSANDGYYNQRLSVGYCNANNYQYDYQLWGIDSVGGRWANYTNPWFSPARVGVMLPYWLSLLTF